MSELQEFLAWQNEPDRKRRLEEGMRMGEFIKRVDGVVVCKTCGGNCGQCGVTSTVGNVAFSLDTIIESVHPKKSPDLSPFEAKISEPPLARRLTIAAALVGILSGLGACAIRLFG
jgi:hypothetical protein